MKNNALLLFTFFCLTFQMMVSQRPQNRNFQLQKFEISGKVLDKETQQPLEYATIILTHLRSKRVTGGITDKNGNFKVEAPKGLYNIAIEFLSFKTVKINNKQITEATNLGIISLEIDSENLEEIEIIAEKTTVEIRLDKKIYNVGKDLTVSGGTASDVLDNIPSVTVDVEGNVALRGNDNVRILINGKPSGLIGADPAEALRQFPADAIEKVEVITSPSARYDAEGTAGILNIVLRRAKTLGFNGLVTLSSGTPDRAGGSANLNFRTKKVNYFINSGYNYRKMPGNAFYDTEFLSPTIENPFAEETGEYDRTRKNLNLNAGLEYFFDKKTSVTGSIIYRDADRKTETDNTTNEFDTDQFFVSEDFRQEVEDEIDEEVQFSFNFTKNFAKNGHKLTFDAQFEKNIDEERSLISDEQILPNLTNNGQEKVASLEDNKEQLFQGDYVLPLGENAQFEAGFRSVLKDESTDYTLEEEDLNTGVFIQNNDVSNVFDYTENIHAVYTQYGNKFGKFSALLGLRVEISDIRGKTTSSEEALGINSNFDKDYTGLFPTLNLTYEFNDTESMSLGYNRRINRPRHWFINPFPSRASETQVFQGNPDLNPAYSNALDIGYLKRWDKITFSTSIYYNRTTDVFQFINLETGELTTSGIPIITRTPINLSTDDRFGFEFSVNYSPKKWLRLSNSFNLFNSERKGVFDGIDYGVNNTSWFTRFSSKVSLPSKIDWQTSARYRGKRKDAQSNNKGIFVINMALSKDLLKEKATVAFNVSDLLNDRKRKANISTPAFDQYSEFQWRERQFTLSFTYRFNQKKKRPQRQRNGNGDDEEFGG